jgi:enamine deaminase RidA (YjgF/YER057c/UK114 family)
MRVQHGSSSRCANRTVRSVAHRSSDRRSRREDARRVALRARRARVGTLVVLSGIPAALGATDEEKIRAMFERARVALESAGASFDDVIEIQTFHTAPTHDAFARDFEIMARVHAATFRAPYPAWTAIGNAALLAKDAIVEMRLVAIVGSGRGARIERH